MDVLIVTWQGGGATQPAFGLGRGLSERGHRVRILAPAAYAGRAEAAGCEHRPLPPGNEFDAAAGRAVEDQMSYLDEIVLGADLPAALAAECEAEPPDAIVVDYLMRSTLCRAEALGIPWFTLVHTTYRFFGTLIGDGEEEWGWRWQYRRVNEIREQLGLAPLPIGPESLGVTMMRRATGALVTMPPEFDEWEVEAPPNLVHAGPIFEEPPGAVTWDSPWPAEDRRPLVVVSLGSTYMHQEELLGRVASAVSDLDVRALVLTGPELDPGELRLPSSVWTMAFVPHSAVLPEAALVVTHGGIGTLMASFAAGVPTLCIPLGRD